ncbi:MAG: phage tail tape measure protein [Desulfarculus sp.]|nr:phage tail tape measure protein [Desulfarculus sp.]
MAGNVVGQLFIEIGADVATLKTDLGGALKEVEKYAGAAGSALKSVAGMFGIGVGVAGFLNEIKAAVQVYSDLEMQVAKVSTVMDSAGQTQDQFNAKVKAMSDGLRDLSVKSGKATEELGAGLYTVHKSGVDAAQAQDVLTTAVKLGKAAFTDTNTALDALAIVMNNYHLAASEARRASDQLFVATRTGRATLDDLRGAMGRLLPTAAEVGVNFETVAAMLSTVTRQGIDAGKAAQALNMIMAGMNKAGDEQKKAWADITKGTELAGRQYDATLLSGQNLLAFLNVLGQASQQEVARLVGSSRTMAAINALINDQAGLRANLARQMDAARRATRPTGLPTWSGR